MAKNIIGLDGVNVPFTCENSRYKTNVVRGHSHHPNAPSSGNALESALIDSGDCSLWLEHVIDKNSGEECYWLMWYYPTGLPTIPMSGVFGKAEIEKMVEKLKCIP